MTAERATTRREFLEGKSAVAALTAAVDRQLAPPDVAAPDAGETYLLRLARQAMACQFEVILNAGQYPAASELAIKALDLVDELEGQLTVYRAAANGPVPVESRLFELLKRALELHHQTEGAFDITSGPLIRAWGFDKRQGAMPGDDELRAALAGVGMRHLMLADDAKTIQFDRPGVEINLGAIGKGYALDRAAELLTEQGIDDFLLHGGQSSVLARGSRAGSSGWVVGIRDPLRKNRRLAEIELRDRALGTSGSSVQFFRHQGRRFGHILDPRTGWPAEGVLSATAIAGTAAEADALATAFYVLGVEKSLAYCARRPDVGVVMVGGNESQGSSKLYWSGLDDREIRFPQ
jgi:thiamine biosynthesis lipoprotein